MSIIKSVLHIFNGKTKSFDTYHPETEVAQVTDWNAGIVNTLASTGLSSLVSTLTSDSLLALLIKKVFDATGVKYSLGQNGYVCFGSLVGGLIIQWGRYSLGNPDGGWITFPVSFSNTKYVINVTHYNSLSERIDIYTEVSYLATSQCYIRSSKESTEVHVIAIGY